MKRTLLFFAIFILSVTSFAQKEVQIRNLWTEPRVHVLFQGYTVSFSIKDINRALLLLYKNGISVYDTTSGLDTNKHHHVELYPGYRLQYRSGLQQILHLAVGAFLLTKGRAVIENPKHKKLKSIIIDVQPLSQGEHEYDTKVYDPAANKLIFNGKLPEAIRNADLGIDYW